MLMEFAALPMVKHSFSGVTLFAPIPGSRATNSSRDHYNTYQFYLTEDSDVCGCSKKMSYMQWLRRYRVVDAEKKIVRRRTASGPAKNACAVAMSFPFELLDIYVGAYAASFLEGMPEYRLLPNSDKDADHYNRSFHAEVCRRKSFAAPEGCRHLKAVLCLDEFQQTGADPMVFNPDVPRFLESMTNEFLFRGMGEDRIATFRARIHACTLLLLSVRDGREDPAMWTARRVKLPPQRSWSPEQQDVLNKISMGTNISDATSMQESNRILHICGGPGTGKTEVVIAAAHQALDDGCRVLIAGPIGLLVSMYRKRLPATDNLTMETLHSAFRIVRDEDAAYSPPGRLRRYDLIIIDEVSQIDGIVWSKLKTALGELAPCPFIVLVGDFQQLQPLGTGPVLQNELEQQISNRKVVMVRLLHHQAARSVDAAMLDFLEAARVQQPSRQDLIDFFQDRVWPSDLDTVCRAAKAIEDSEHKEFTFLTVKNRGAADLNLARLALDFPAEAQMLRNGEGIPGDVGHVVLAAGMRVRLTHNIDKDRDFVNGTTGLIRSLLRKDVFILKSSQDISILVHPVTLKGRKFVPVAYSWATTIRRAQGATLDKIGLFFDRRLADRGYAYVGCSRAKRREDVFHVGRIRRTDWRAVNGDNADEQSHISVLSESTNASEEARDSDFASCSTDTEPHGSDFASCSTDTEPHGSEGSSYTTEVHTSDMMSDSMPSQEHESESQADD